MGDVGEAGKVTGPEHDNGTGYGEMLVMGDAGIDSNEEKT